jgi:hypothetical protein
VPPRPLIALTSQRHDANKLSKMDVIYFVVIVIGELMVLVLPEVSALRWGMVGRSGALTAHYQLCGDY